MDDESLVIERVLALLSNKWRLSLLCTLSERGPIRFNDLQKNLPGISQKVLTEHLKTLEAEGIVKRMSYGEVPPRVEYSVTKLGDELEELIQAAYKWGEKYLASQSAAKP